MRFLAFLLLLVTAQAQAQFASGRSTLTSGTTATSGCTAGGVLHSASSVIVCSDANFIYNATASVGGGPRLTVGSSNGTSQGWHFGSQGSGASGLWATNVTPSATNYLLYSASGFTAIGVANGTEFSLVRAGTTILMTYPGTVGEGLSITPATATTNVPAFSVTRTNNNAAVATGVKFTFTDTSSAAGFLPLQILGGSGATTNLLSVPKEGGLAVKAKIHSGTAPTIASGGCTSPTVTNENGTAHFTIDVGTGCSGSQPVVFTLPSATTGWNCYARNITNGATSAPAQTGAVSTTSVTITNFVRTTGVAGAWTDGDDVVVSCLGG